MNRAIFVLSDSLGDTAEKVLRAALTQFPEDHYELHRHAFVETQEEMERILTRAAQLQALVFYTFVQYDKRRFLDDSALRQGIQVFDLMGPLLHSLGVFLEERPAEIPGSQYRMDRSYFQRMEAIEFAVRYDDGKDPRGILKADLVLLGISRTGKTPLSMYLAGLRLKVANVPLLPEVEVPEELFQIEAKRIVGLTHEVEVLCRIRGERLRQMGLAPEGPYAERERIEGELRYADDLFRRIGCRVISVSGLAVEETASMILECLRGGACDSTRRL